MNTVKRDAATTNRKELLVRRVEQRRDNSNDWGRIVFEPRMFSVRELYIFPMQHLNAELRDSGGGYHQFE